MKPCSSPLSYIYLIKWSVADQFSSLTAWGKKLLWCQILLYLLPDVSTVNRLWLGWVSSFSNLWALSRHLTLLISLMFYMWVPVMFWPVKHLL